MIAKMFVVMVMCGAGFCCMQNQISLFGLCYEGEWVYEIRETFVYIKRCNFSAKHVCVSSTDCRPTYICEAVICVCPNRTFEFADTCIKGTRKIFRPDFFCEKRVFFVSEKTKMCHEVCSTGVCLHERCISPSFFIVLIITSITSVFIALMLST